MTDNNQFNSDGYVSEPAPRKATDVLLAIESKVDILTKIIFNQDMLLKLVADRTNKIYAYIDELKQEYVSSQQPEDGSQESDEPRIIDVSNEHVITEAKQPNVSSVRAARVYPATPIANSPQSILLIPNPPPSEDSTPQQSDSGNDKKVPVMQRVSDHAGHDLFMCSVSILDESGKEIHKTKTNAMGKWQCLLKPGSYSVKITKTDTTTKKILERTQSITVKNSNSPITLPVVIIQR